MTGSEKLSFDNESKPQNESAAWRLAEDLDAYETMRDQLKRTHWGKWVVLCKAELAGTYETVGDATKGTVTHCTHGQCRIREVGAPE